MGKIVEKQTVLGTIYERQTNQGEVISTYGVIGFKKEYDEDVYFILTNLNGERIKVANKYLNVTIKNAGYKKREMAFSALKLLYSFIQVYNIQHYEEGLDQESITKLVMFLEGGKRKATIWNQDFETIRSNNTINNYFSVYRDFFKRNYVLKNTELFDSSTVAIHSGGGMLGHANKNAVQQYTTTKKIRKNATTPKYIKETEYESILRLIQEKYTLREEVIIRLMYEYGLRIGEVLGLTFEDLEESLNGNYKIIIRNRKSDQPWQSAKSVMNIKSTEDYKKRHYQMEGNGLGYQYVLVEDKMMELIEEYVDETRDEMVLNQSEIKRKNLETKSKADKVTDNELMYAENQYLFLNQKQYTPLTVSGWNYILKLIFKELHIQLDENVKENNLSHRFRHAYAMNRVKQGFTQEELASLLRHSSTSTVKKYFNPDEEYKVELLERQRKHMERDGVGFDIENI